MQRSACGSAGFRRSSVPGDGSWRSSGGSNWYRWVIPTTATSLLRNVHRGELSNLILETVMLLFLLLYLWLLLLLLLCCLLLWWLLLLVVVVVKLNRLMYHRQGLYLWLWLLQGRTSLQVAALVLVLHHQVEALGVEVRQHRWMEFLSHAADPGPPNVLRRHLRGLQ